MTIRFRKWSRKAYAVFASIGRNVTIGCLPKSVADSSLSKQKSGTAAGCKSSGANNCGANDGKSRDTDIGISSSDESGADKLLILFNLRRIRPVLCPVSSNPAREKETDITINKSG